VGTLIAPGSAVRTTRLRLSSVGRSLCKLLVGLALIGALLWRLDVYVVIAALDKYRWSYLLAASLLFLTSFPISALRWKLFAPRFALRALLELTLIGQFYAVVLPGQLAGELVKAYRLAKGKADAERLAVSVFVDRVLGMVALLLVAGAGIVFSPHRLPAVLSYLVAALMLLLLAGLFAFRIRALYALVIPFTRRLHRTRLQRLASGLERAFDAWRDFSHSPARLLASISLGVVFQCLNVAIHAVLAANLGIALPLADWAWVVAVESLAVLLPISIGGLGLREGALIGCLVHLGVTGEAALALSLGIFAIMLFGALLGALVELVAQRTNRSSSADAL